MRKLMLLFLMLCLPLQMISAAERGIAHSSGDQNAPGGIQHVMAHAEHMPHHHHDDGKVHIDDSSASTQHQLDCEKSCAMSIILTAGQQLAIDVVPHTVPLFHAGVVPERTTIPPLRPPHLPA